MKNIIMLLSLMLTVMISCESQYDHPVTFEVVNKEKGLMVISQANHSVSVNVYRESIIIFASVGKDGAMIQIPKDKTPTGYFYSSDLSIEEVKDAIYGPFED